MAGARAALLVATFAAFGPSPAAGMTPLDPRLREGAGKTPGAGYPGPRVAAESAEGGLFSPSRSSALRTRGTIKPLVLLVDFPDVDPRFNADRVAHPQAYFEQLLFATSGKSLRTFYRENSYGALEVAGDVADWVTCRQSYANYYVNRDQQPGTPDDHGFDLSPGAFNPEIDPYPKNVWGMVMEAATLADSTVDFSEYDGDGDGVVDALFVVHAGLGGEQVPAFLNPDFIWSHKSNLTAYLASIGRPPFRSKEGTILGEYVMIAERGPLGVPCHEFCHLFGLPDLYRTDTETGEQSSIVGGFDLMDYGPWHDNGRTPGHLGAWSKYQLGWIRPIPIAVEPGGTPEVSGARIFASASGDTSSAFFRLLANPSGPDWTIGRVGRGEYFLIENRVPGKLNFDQYLPSSGMAIWHVDETRPNNNSASVSDRLLTLIQADGDDWTSFTHDPEGEPGDLWPGPRSFASWSDETVPGSRLNDGAFSGAEALDIHKEGDVIAADLSVESIRVGEPYAYPNPVLVDPVSGAELSFVYQPQSVGSPGGTPPPVPLAVRIYDLAGEMVRSIEAPQSPAVWDCKNEHGELVGSGVYFYVIAAQGASASGKVAVVR